MEDRNTLVAELERRAEIEVQRLGVAEDLGWVIAVLAALVVYLKWGGWLLPVFALLGSHFLVTYPYRRRESAAEDAYHKASGMGKYYAPPKDP